MLKGGNGRAFTIMETMATMVNIIKTTVAGEELSRRQAMIAFIHKHNKNKQEPKNLRTTSVSAAFYL